MSLSDERAAELARLANRNKRDAEDYNRRWKDRVPTTPAPVSLFPSEVLSLLAAREEGERLREALANRVLLISDNESVRMKFATAEDANACYEAITRIPINAQV